MGRGQGMALMRKSSVFDRLQNEWTLRQEDKINEHSHPNNLSNASTIHLYATAIGEHTTRAANTAAGSEASAGAGAGAG